jgi:hypothetical protein
MVARRLVEGSSDVLAAAVLDAAGAVVETDGVDAAGARELGELARELVECADTASDRPVEQIEVQTVGGSVFAVRDSRHEVVCVTRRAALPALVLYDLRHALAELAR